MNRRVVAALLGTFAAAGTPGVNAEFTSGQTLDASTAAAAEALLPPEILRHYQRGEYVNRVVDFPDSRWDWDDTFKAATVWNRGHLVLDANKSPVDRETGGRPEYLQGLPFPDVDADDPDAGSKILWNLAYGYYAGGNSRNYTELDWVSRTGRERVSVQDVYSLYYEGQPRQYAPRTNPQNLLYQMLATTITPADLQGTAALSYRFKDATKRDLSWAYVPALRRVRAVSPSNRSDGFLGSDQSQDDGFFFDGKPEDFTWRAVGRREGLRIVDPGSIEGREVQVALPGGGWRTHATDAAGLLGYMQPEWKGVAWAPCGAALARRHFWVVEGVPKDKYYLFGKLELWVDTVTWQGAWNRKFSWRGDLLNTYQVMGHATGAFDEDERWWSATMDMQLSENLKDDRATISGLPAPGEDPANDRRIPLDPSFFDFATLNRFGK